MALSNPPYFNPVIKSYIVLIKSSNYNRIFISIYLEDYQITKRLMASVNSTLATLSSFILVLIGSTYGHSLLNDFAQLDPRCSYLRYQMIISRNEHVPWFVSNCDCEISEIDQLIADSQ